MGQVVETKTNSIQFASGFNFFAFPYPSAKKLIETDLENDGIHGAESLGGADNVIAWDPVLNDYHYYWYYDDGNVQGWVDQETGDLADDKMLAVGEGHWYLRRAGTTMTWTEPKPYTYPGN